MSINTSIKAYQDNAKTTATYRSEQVFTQVQALSYLGLGICGEATEVLDKVMQTSLWVRKDVAPPPPGHLEMAATIKELGDVLWYVAMSCTELNFDLRNLLYVQTGIPAEEVTFPSYQANVKSGYEPSLIKGYEAFEIADSAMRLTVQAGLVAEVIKKVARKGLGAVPEQVRQRLGGIIAGVFLYVAQLCVVLECDLGDVAQANATKLASRKARGVILGDGDNR